MYEPKTSSPILMTGQGCHTVITTAPPSRMVNDAKALAILMAISGMVVLAAIVSWLN